MPFDKFNKRKNDVLSKEDKSHKGSWDKKIVNVCKNVNSLNDYYTTSSCSGRIVLIIDKDKKQEGLFVKVYHDLISFEELKEDLLNIIIKQNEKPIKFKMEPCALHVACRDFESVQKLYNLGKLAGWKKSGIIASGRRFVVELNSTERLEFPIIKQKKILVGDEFLRIITENANKKLKKCWEKIEKLEKCIRILILENRRIFK